MTKCLVCNQEIKETKVCPHCGNSNLAIFEKNKINYKGKQYSLRKWYLFLTPHLTKGKEQIIAKHRDEKISYDYLYSIFLRNCWKHTFLGLILPSVLFFVIACVNIVIPIIGLDKVNIIIDGSKENVEYFLYFLGILCFVFFIGVFYLWAIKKQKCYIAIVRKQTRYVHITKEKYNEIIKDFNSLRNKDEQGEI